MSIFKPKDKSKGPILNSSPEKQRSEDPLGPLGSQQAAEKPKPKKKAEKKDEDPIITTNTFTLKREKPKESVKPNLTVSNNSNGKSTGSSDLFGGVD
mmetsp:Transcript_41380/g.36741  ORF Transcript_41380/g.36741 Transcript_41380/m.36741 type:complete len:97 (+) Transcript_41380:999-1289(+)